uniref:DUF1985 domain-containing protein n=1 Tax=Solanum lycopersicum TaxID=4081 RepID=A0A3Q7ITA8_SOLLC
MKIRKCVAQDQIHRCCMSLEVEVSSKQSLVIKVNGAILKFTIRTFAVIIGLNCVGVVEDFKFNTEEPNQLILQYFGGDEIIRRSDLINRFNDKSFTNTVTQMGTLQILELLSSMRHMLSFPYRCASPKVQ